MPAAPPPTIAMRLRVSSLVDMLDYSKEVGYGMTIILTAIQACIVQMTTSRTGRSMFAYLLLLLYVAECAGAQSQTFPMARKRSMERLVSSLISL